MGPLVEQEAASTPSSATCSSAATRAPSCSGGASDRGRRARPSGSTTRRRSSRRRQLDEDRPGRDLRPGAVRDPVRRRRRGDRDRERLDLRARPAACGRRTSPAPQRVAASMRTGTVWINDYHMISDLGAVRRLQAERRRARARPLRPRGVHRGQARARRLARATRRCAPATVCCSSYPRTSGFEWAGPTRSTIGAGRVARGRRRGRRGSAARACC